MVSQVLPMCSPQLIERKIKHRKSVRSAFEKDSLRLPHFIGIVKDLFYFPLFSTVFSEYAKEHTECLTLLEFKRYLENHSTLKPDSDRIINLLHKLITKGNKDDDSDQDLVFAKELFGGYASVTINGFLSIFGFAQFMFYIGCESYDHTKKEVYQDMTLPLSSYFINSGHNSYLESYQLVGQSTADAYTKALLAGARCVEIDLWDGPKGEPLVTHGHTLTSRVTAESVLIAIKESAFINSPYPVILSLENHLCIDQQVTFAIHCKNILGDQLVTKKNSPWSPGLENLPSPEALKGKFIIKNKAHCARRASICSFTDAANEVKQQPLAAALSDLVVYCKSVDFVDLQTSINKSKCYEMSSFPEKKALKLLKEDPLSFSVLTSNRLGRCYPDIMRVSSSNYDPQPMWNVGIQMVALNFQTADRSMQLNCGRFSDNGGCGYVLKPRFLRYPSALTPLEISKLSIRLIHGFHLFGEDSVTKRNKSTSVYVEVEVTGIRNQNSISPIAAKSDTPTWDHTFDFDVIMPDIALVRFTIMDSRSNEPIGYYIIPYNCLRTGLCRIPVFKFKPFGLVEVIPSASLFIVVDKTMLTNTTYTIADCTDA